MKSAFIVASVLAVLSAVVQAQTNHLDRIASAKELRACIWPDYFGISYRSPKTQQLEGIDIDMALAQIGRAHV